MYRYNTENRTPKYNPKLYLGTSQTIAIQWNFDIQRDINYPSIWPQNSSQKGEANKYKQKKLPFLNTSKQQFVNYLSIISLF